MAATDKTGLKRVRSAETNTYNQGKKGGFAKEIKGYGAVGTKTFQRPKGAARR